VKAITRALLDELDDDDWREVAHRLAPHLPTSAPDGWLCTRDAACYAGCSIDALHRAMAAREVAFEQTCAGGKAWFKRSEIDAWRRGERP
jgi:hypothetical protein